MPRFNEKDFQPYHTMHSIVLPSIIRHLAWLVGCTISAIIIFLTVTPWVQTAPGQGVVTTLNPNDRAQHINALVSGRIKQWYVQDGANVKKGDPIVEIIDNDSQIIARLESERDAHQQSLTAAKIAAKTALKNYERQKSLYAKGLSSEKAVENANISHKNQISRQADAQAKLNQADIKLSRQQTQFIVAPRDGTIVSIVAADIATTVKAGDKLATFVPDNVPLSVEIFVSGLDVSLIQPGRQVRLQFEGWPAVQFSGWPSSAIGTYGGIVEAVDPVISPNGRFRVLVVPDPADKAEWPEARFLRYGSKVKGWILLDTVSVGYELWRKLNNFPPEYPKDNASSLKVNAP